MEGGDGGHIRLLKCNFASILLALSTGAVAIFATGCWMMAAQLAPVAISAAEEVGSGMIHLTAGVATAVTMEKHKDEDAAKIEPSKTEPVKTLDHQQPESAAAAAAKSRAQV